MNGQLDALRRTAVQLRLDIMELVYRGQGPAHPAPSLSCADILTALYFDCMHLRPQEPRWADRDRFILSKGHAAPALYAALARRGYFSPELYPTLRRRGSMLQGHPDMNKTPGVDMTSGSLGNGLAAGVGMAYTLKVLQKRKSNVYVLLGDGETQEGIVWEAALSAAKYRLDNLVAIVDYNHIQSGGFQEDIMPMEPMADKWKAFGFRVLEVNGHDLQALTAAFAHAREMKGMSTLVLAHTTKGKGVSFMENVPAWHSRIPTEAEYIQAVAELTALQAQLGGETQ